MDYEKLPKKITVNGKSYIKNTEVFYELSKEAKSRYRNNPKTFYVRVQSLIKDGYIPYVRDEVRRATYIPEIYVQFFEELESTQTVQFLISIFNRNNP